MWTPARYPRITQGIMQGQAFGRPLFCTLTLWSVTAQGTMRGQECPLFRIPTLWLVNYKQQGGQ